MYNLGKITEKTIKKSKYGKIVRSYRLRSNEINLYTLFDRNNVVVVQSIDLNYIIDQYCTMIKMKLDYINPNRTMY